MIKYTGDLRRDFEKAKQKAEYDSVIAEKDAIIKALSNELAHLKAAAGHDGTNTGISTSATPIGKNKVIPNSRRGSGKTRGGQPGHEKHTMGSFEGSEIDETISHMFSEDDMTCDKCGAGLYDTGEVEAKDESDVIIKTIKRRHEYHIYECMACGERVRLAIDRNHKEQNQYGSNTQALALSLMSTGNVAINKVRMLISGMTGDAMRLSEGYISKLYKRAAKLLAAFVSDLRILMIKRTLIYWDDTVIMIKTSRACMRFYGDEIIAYYTAHMHKDLDSLLEDNILPVLTGETTVMHDHNKVNYNDRFCFKNIECNQHLQRDLQKVTDDFPGHKWSGQLKELIATTIKDRRDWIAAAGDRFQKSRFPRSSRN